MGNKRPVRRRSPAVTIKRQVRLVYELMRDRRVPIWLKLIPLVGILYLISPIELLPDVALFPFGILDDVVVIVLCLIIFVAMVPRAIIDDHISWLDAADITMDDLQEDRRRLPPGEGKDS